MTTDTTTNIFADYIKEVEGYIPTIKLELSKLRKDSSNRSALDEIFRLVHIVRGASALMDIPSLSNIAQAAETMLEQCQDGKVSLSESVYTKIEELLNIFSEYCIEMRQGGNFPSKALQKKGDIFCGKKGVDEIAEASQLKIDNEDDILTTGFDNPLETITPFDGSFADDSSLLLGGEFDNSLDHLLNDNLFDEDLTDTPPESLVSSAPPAEMQKEKTEKPEDSSLSTSLFSEEEQKFLQEGFFEEAAEHMQEAYQMLQKLEQGGENYQGEAEIRAIRRCVHTVKGAAAVVGLQDISAYGHKFEDMLDWLHDNPRPMGQGILTPLATALDFLNDIIENPAKTNDSKKEDIYKQLAEIPLNESKGTAPDTVTQIESFSAELDSTLPNELLQESLLALNEDFSQNHKPLPSEIPLDSSVSKEQSDNSSLSANLFSEEEKQLLQEGFFEEAAEHIQEAYQILQTLEQGGEGYQGADEICGIRRCVHTIKGAAAVVGLQEISAFGHKFEDMLDSLHDNPRPMNREILSPLGTALDFLNEIIEDPKKANDPRKEIIYQQLDKIPVKIEDSTNALTVTATSALSEDNQLAEDDLSFLKTELSHLDHSIPEDSSTLHDEPSDNNYGSDARTNELLDTDIADIDSLLSQGIQEDIDFSTLIDNRLTEDIFEEDDEPVESSLSDTLFTEEELVELQQGFYEEVGEHLEEIYTALQKLEHNAEASGTEHREDVRVIRRAVHTIKGSAAVIGLGSIAKYGHKVEDFLDWLYETSQQVTRKIFLALAAAIDVLNNIVEDPTTITDTQKEEIYRQLFDLSSTPPEELVGQDKSNVSTQTLATSQLDSYQKEEATVEFDQGLGELEGLEDLDLLDFEVDEQDVVDTEWQQGENEDKSARVLEGNNSERNSSSSTQAKEEEKSSTGLFEVAAPKVSTASSMAVSAFIGSSEERSKKEEANAQLFAQPLEKSITITQKEPDQKRQHSALPKPSTIQLEGMLSLGELTKNIKVPDNIEQSSTTDTTPQRRTLRVDQSRFDHLMNLVNNLLIGMSNYEQNMEQLGTALDELGIASQRLKDIALDLEKNYEVKALDQINVQLNHLENVKEDIQKSLDFSEFDSLELDHYSQLHLIIRSLNESSVDFLTLHENFGKIHSGLSGNIGRQYQVVRELQMQMVRTRLTPLSILRPRLSRTVREVSKTLDKPVQFVMQGEWTELDRTMWEKLADPFMHLLRNAIHHGIESPEERRASGKAPIATISISGTREGHYVYIRCQDDGQGFDFPAIKRRAKALNIQPDPETMSEAQLAELVFASGFTTKTEVNEISGRGVGMDVVRENIRELQGDIEIDTVPGKGTTFILRIPLTMGIVRILQVNILGVMYGIALEDVKMIQRVQKSQIDEKRGIIMREGKELSLFSLGKVIDDSYEEKDQAAERPLIAFVEHRKELVAVRIPEVSAQREVVIKELGDFLHGISGVSGAAVMGDGTIIPVLNLFDLIGEVHRKIEQGVLAPQEKASPAKKIAIPKGFTIMVVDDSISIRRVMSRLVTSRGWHAVEAKDGQNALELLETVQPNCILLDIEMPRLNGFEFLTIKSNISAYKDIPVVMLTSRSSDKHRTKALELGASAFLNKPSSDAELVATIREVIIKKEQQKNAALQEEISVQI